MEHLYSPSLHAVPWRTRALIASAVAAVELALLLLIGLAVLGKSLSAGFEQAARSHAIAKDRPVVPKPQDASATTPRLERAETSVLVLNGNGRRGAAAETADRVRGLHYLIGGVGNAPRTDGGPSVVMYRPAYAPEAKRLARDLRIKVVGPLDGLRLRDLMGAHVAVVVGS